MVGRPIGLLSQGWEIIGHMEVTLQQEIKLE